jgi:tRNA nucleotidyltransferase (CCA-adding enzyme)
VILVTTHENADFDCAAGVMAALLLHPGAVASFPGAKSPAVAEHLSSHPGLIPELRSPDVDLAQVDTLVLVDTVAPDRIGRFRELLDPDRPVRIVCYDHHQRTSPPDRAELHVRPTGAVATLMCDLLRRRGIEPTPQQATLLALGIYEDTGGMLFAGTTPDDLRQASWLLEIGADLSEVSRALARGLTPDQVDLYHAILHASRTRRIHGREVVIAAVAVDRFVQEASVVVQQYVQATGVERAVFLIRMNDRIVLISRSRVPDFDASRVAMPFGGGGHSVAASAILRERTLIEAEHEVERILGEAMEPALRASALATPILYTVAADASVARGVELLNRYRVNALPVMEGGTVVGALTRQVADVALHHGLKQRKVRDLVASSLEVMRPDADLDEVKRRLLTGSERFLLVGEDRSRITGIITRTALLRHLYESGVGSGPSRVAGPEEDGGKEGEDLSPMLARRLPAESVDLLRVVGELAEASGSTAYLVGGVVRDLLLRQETRDLDVVVEGDACALAKALGERLRATVRVHEAFQTAAVSLPSGIRLDLATARTEHYVRPGALPEVAPGGLRQDLFRRDFTINTLAIRLTGPGFGRILDFFGGRNDLLAGKIRVLHGLSFIEDPTRALRAIRFATRFDFEIARETAHLMNVARREKVFDRLSPQRLRRELEQLFSERRLATAVRMAGSFQLLTVIHPGLRPTRRAWARVERAEEVLGWYRLLYRRDAPLGWVIALGILAEPLDAGARGELLERLRPGRRAARILRRAPEAVHRIIAELAARRPFPPSRIHEVCREHPPETLLLAMAATPRERVRKALALYISRLRDVRPDVRGRDLLSAGIPPGPRVAAGLDAALKAKLDGRATDREGQMEAALRAARTA